jgi:hypothetical protein
MTRRRSPDSAATRGVVRIERMRLLKMGYFRKGR